jgi:hypothetical protein
MELTIPDSLKSYVRQALEDKAHVEASKARQTATPAAAAMHYNSAGKLLELAEIIARSK